LSSRWIRSLQASDFSSASQDARRLLGRGSAARDPRRAEPGERAKVLLGEEAYEAAYREGTALAFDALIAEARWPG